MLSLQSLARNLGRVRCSPSIRLIHSTPLEKLLLKSVQATGPLTTAQYMRMCLSHPVEGYYMKGDVFGAHGDFITSPEISQTFGEIVAVWLVSRWIAAGTSLPIRLIELGPGRGTLTQDILRTVRSFQVLRGIPITVQLVETSERLRELQKAKLLSSDKPAHPPNVQWYNSIDAIPAHTDPVFTMIVAHELFDALPIHIIEGSNAGFSEVLVGSKGGLSNHQPSDSPFCFVKSPMNTPGAALLAASSARFNFKNGSPVPTRIEVCPEGWKLARALGELISKPGAGGGAGLIIDYGDQNYFGNSLRQAKLTRLLHSLSHVQAFRKHKQVDVFDEPGNTDLTANVDFAYLREAIDPVARTLGPITQRDFLLGMGLGLRVNKLVERAPDAQRKRHIAQAADRLVSLTGMGKEYKAMAIVPRGNSESLEEICSFPT